MPGEGLKIRLPSKASEAKARIVAERPLHGPARTSVDAVGQRAAKRRTTERRARVLEKRTTRGGCCLQRVLIHRSNLLRWDRGGVNMGIGEWTVPAQRPLDNF